MSKEKLQDDSWEFVPAHFDHAGNWIPDYYERDGKGTPGLSFDTIMYSPGGKTGQASVSDAWPLTGPYDALEQLRVDPDYAVIKRALENNSPQLAPTRKPGQRTRPMTDQEWNENFAGRSIKIPSSESWFGCLMVGGAISLTGIITVAYFALINKP